MDPQVAVSTPQLPKRFTKPLNKKVVILSTILLIIIGAALGTLLYKNYAKKITISNKTLTPKFKAPLGPKEDLEQTINLTFTQEKDQDIVKFVSFASKDRTLATKYVDYSKAYQLIYQRYGNTQDIRIKKAQVKLRVFLKSFPQFKEADFKLIK